MPDAKYGTSLKVSEELYERLVYLKQLYNCTYSEVVQMLIELELKNNYIMDIKDYLFVTERDEYYFRILFKKQETIIEFHTDKGFIRDKKNWKIHPNDKTLFTQFMNKPDSIILLKNMGNSMEFDKFIILKL